MKKANCQTLRDCIDYGEHLNVAFAQHQLEKDKGEMEVTWKIWFMRTVGISAPQVRKIGAVATLLGPYPAFRKLGFSFDEIYRRRNKIKAMLDAQTQPWVQYWQQPQQF